MYFSRLLVVLMNAISGQVALAEDISYLRSLTLYPFFYHRAYALRYKYPAPMELTADESSRVG